MSIVLSGWKRKTGGSDAPGQRHPASGWWSLLYHSRFCATQLALRRSTGGRIDTGPCYVLYGTSRRAGPGGINPPARPVSPAPVSNAASPGQFPNHQAS